MSIKPLLAVAAISIIWGTTYLAIRIGVKDFPPFLFSGLRFILAGGIITSYFLLKGHSWPSLMDFLNLMVSGLSICLGGNLMLCLAEKNVPSGLAALISCALPFWIVIISKVIHKAEKITFITNAGLAIGFTGQLLIFYDQIKFISTASYLTGIIFSVISVFFGAFGSVYMKKHSVKSNPVFSGGIQMLFSGVIIATIGLFIGEIHVMHVSIAGIQAFLYLVVAGSIVGYSCFCYAISKLPATLVSVYTYINPIVALWLGWLILNERITWMMILAMLITVAGVYIVKRGAYQNKNVLREGG